MVKKTLALFMTLLFVCMLMPLAIAQGTPTISVSSATAQPGETVELKVSISNNPGINALKIGFKFDAEKLELKEVKKADDLSGQMVYGKKAVWFNSKDTDFNGDYLNLVFEIAQSATNGKTEVAVVYDQGDIANYQEENIEFKCISGSIMIEGETSSAQDREPLVIKEDTAEKPSIIKSIGSFF